MPTTTKGPQINPRCIHYQGETVAQTQREQQISQVEEVNTGGGGELHAK